MTTFVRRLIDLVRYHRHPHSQPHSGGYDCAWCEPGSRLCTAWLEACSRWNELRARLRA